MIKKSVTSEFSVSGIVQNNLKNIDISGKTGEIILVSGISGSGKSTLVDKVIVAEANRQEAMRRKTDDLYVYAVRPKISASTQLPTAISVSQRTLVQTQLSTFGTRTGLRGAIQQIFVKQGKIIYQGIHIKKPSLVEIREFAKNYYPKAKLYAVLSSYEPVSRNILLAQLKKHGVGMIYLRDEKKGVFRQVSIFKLPIHGLSDYELMVDLDSCSTDDVVTELAPAGVLLLGDDIELNFKEYYFSLPDGTVFRRPSRLLFSKSTVSSLSGCCKACNGSGSRLSVNLSNVIDAKAPIQSGFLNVPLSKSGRYVGFKFLPGGLANLLKKQGVDTKKTFADLLPEAQDIVITTLTEKLHSNQKDEQARQYLSEMPCLECEGTGYGYQTRAVLVGGKPIHYYLSLTADDLSHHLDALNLDKGLKADIERLLSLISKLAIDHIALDRATSSISSGEAQRIKLLDVLMSQDSGKIVVLDEPSSNLQYRDNLHIIDVILEIKSRDNCVIIVDHNPLYHCIADRIIKVGPGAGSEGGHVSEHKISTNKCNLTFQSQDFEVDSLTKPKFKTVKLRAKHNLKLTNITFPKETVTVVIGSSGSGKTTLVLDLIYNSLVAEGEHVVKLDSKPPGKSPRSIVATYLEVFDEVRKTYANAAAPYLRESDFSFNAAGACTQCGGSGQDVDKLCAVCFGSRYRPDVSLVKVEDKSIVELLNFDIKQINTGGVFGFLSEAIRIFEDLSLTHIALGRATSTLSGGEIQRLKLAKFILNHYNTLGESGVYVILDEPCRGLDRKAILKLHQAISHYLGHCTVLVIEHNPDFIYQCRYVIDLGAARGEKTSADIVAGFAKEKSFPSMNHRAVFDELHTVTTRDRGLNSTANPVVTNNLTETDRVNEGKYFQLVHPVFIRQENFALEERFTSNFDVVVKDKNVVFYHSREAMRTAVASVSKFLYNPFVSFLEKYPKVPHSIYAEIISRLNKADLALDADPWRVLVKSEIFDEAFLKGAGVVATYPEKVVVAPENCTYHTIRLFSLVDRVTDGIAPASFAFNLHSNACPYCKGYGHLKSYPFHKWIDTKYSVLDPEMTPYKINRVMPKSVIAKFAKEGLFDFSSVAKTLTQEEFNILLYGFKAYKFKKPGRAGKVEDDFLEWRGLNSYIYHNATKLSPNGNLNQYLELVTCPFCRYGFRSVVERYRHQEKTIVDYLS